MCNTKRHESPLVCSVSLEWCRRSLWSPCLAWGTELCSELWVSSSLSNLGHHTESWCLFAPWGGAMKQFFLLHGQQVIDKNNDTLCVNSGEVKQSQCRPQLYHKIWVYDEGSCEFLHLSSIVYIAQPPTPYITWKLKSVQNLLQRNFHTSFFPFPLSWVPK